MEADGLASACIAANLNKDCLLENSMKINYPVINDQFVTEKDNLGEDLFAYNQMGIYNLYHRPIRIVITASLVRLKTYIDQMWLIDKWE
jgi:hypothetical protein